jgi:hypothetical protein
MMKIYTFCKSYKSYLPALILFAGAILRIIGTGASAIWFDEANTFYRTTIPFMSLFTQDSEASGNLFLEIIERPLMAISHSLWMLRLPSMIAALISLWLVWKLINLLQFSLRQQIMATCLTAFLPGLLWIAQDARSYGILSCLLLAGTYFALKGRWVGILAVCGLTIYAHSTGPVSAAAVLLLALIYNRKDWKKFLLVGTLTVLAWLPAIERMAANLIINQPWEPTLTGSWFMASVTAAFWPQLAPHWFLIGSLLFLYSSLAFIGFTQTFSGGKIFLLMWIIPLAGLIFFSNVQHNNVILYRTLMPMLFPFVLWLGWELGSNSNVPFIRWSFSAYWITILVIGLIFWNPAERGGHLDQEAASIRSQFQPGDVLVYTTQTVALPFEYYLSDLPYTFDDTIRNSFLLIPSIPRISTVNGTPSRRWYIIPHDQIVTQEELSTLMEKVKGGTLMGNLHYLQAAEIDIYLVEGK